MFEWKKQSAAAEFVNQLIKNAEQRSPFVESLSKRMLAETGTRLVDWIDHIELPSSQESAPELESIGFEQEAPGIWHHPGGIFPTILVGQNDLLRIAIRVENIVDFLTSHHSAAGATILGEPGASLRLAPVSHTTSVACWAIERQGNAGFDRANEHCCDVALVNSTAERFDTRPRSFPNSQSGFEVTQDLIRDEIACIGKTRCCELFFASERKYWQSRNRAARVQKARQDELGLGWANHDHHTYRSSRDCFKNLIETLELLGFHCRERFYAGEEAGWGAQVLEQPDCRIVIFADVDLSPEEVASHFARESLESRDELGTVGLWCRLHGEAFFEAGMHHLECQFDFEAAHNQLELLGIRSMPPFTNLGHLKQAFTSGEIWPVDPDRIDELLHSGIIDKNQADQFRTEGAIGSHLEILERNDGFKGFNQTGISDIIKETDPRTIKV